RRERSTTGPARSPSSPPRRRSWSSASPAPSCSHGERRWLRLPPAMAIPLQQSLRLPWPPCSLGVADRRPVVVLPRVEDRLDDSPRGIDLVAADEQRGVADEGVVDEPLVRLGRLHAE